jgi:SpoVK/Ycf46/Vps4 family AAA+-type ATPase
MNKNQINIAVRFKRVVILHIIKNLIGERSTPLILGIHGSSGCGKTYQCECVLNEIGVTPFLISGGQLESGTAGEPAKLIREKYIAASHSIQNRKNQAAVILINDVDTGLGNWGENVQTTINTQTVYGELMHLVDYPTSVEGVTTNRIPIILTGNDFTKLYKPLIRAGRMTSFEWNPTLEEKVEIISGIFSDLSKEEILQLVNNFSDQSIAFFSHLFSVINDDILWEKIQLVGVSKMIKHIQNGERLKINSLIYLDMLIKIGTNLLNSGEMINHLKGQ